MPAAEHVPRMAAEPCGSAPPCPGVCVCVCPLQLFQCGPALKGLFLGHEGGVQVFAIISVLRGTECG